MTRARESRYLWRMHRISAAFVVASFLCFAGCGGSGDNGASNGGGGMSSGGGRGGSNAGGFGAGGSGGQPQRPTPGPIAFWVSQPVAPGESVLVTAGKGMSDKATIDFARLDDDPPGDPPGSSADPGLHWTHAKMNAASTRSASAVIPTSFDVGVFALSLGSDAGPGPTKLVDAPDPWFVIGDLGDAASPGGTLTVSGTCLELDATAPRAALVDKGKVVANLTFKDALAGGGYATDWTVPKSVPPGEYELWLHNGHGGPGAWVRYENFDTKPVTTVKIAKPVAWPAMVVDFSQQSGATADDKFSAAIAKLKTNGGGVLSVPAGTYHLKQQLMLPSHTVLRGAGMAQSKLIWDVSPTAEFDGQQMTWVDTGHDVPLVRSWFVQWGLPDRVTFALEDVSITAPTGYGSSGNANAQAVSRQFVTEFGWLRRIKVLVPNIPASGGAAPPLPAIFLRQARNTEISGSDITGNTSIFARDAVSFTRVENDQLHWTQGIVWLSGGSTANLISGNTFDQLGDSQTNGWATQANPNPGISVTGFYVAADVAPPFDKDILFANNVTTRQAAEVPPGYIGYTSDGEDGVFVGKIASASGTKVKLSAASIGTIDWAGAVLQVMDGAGAGQMRNVVSLPAGSTDVTIDQPFDVPLDPTSVVTVVTRQGRLLFVDNDLTQFPLLQDYYLSIDSIKARNKLGVAGQSLSIVHWAGGHYSGSLPAWHVQVLDNEIEDATSIGFTSHTENPVAGADGVIGAAHVYRNNVAKKPIPIQLHLGSFGGPFADFLDEDEKIDTALFATGSQPTYDLRGVVVMRHDAGASGMTTFQPTDPMGVTIVP